MVFTSVFKLLWYTCCWSSLRFTIFLLNLTIFESEIGNFRTMHIEIITNLLLAVGITFTLTTQAQSIDSLTIESITMGTLDSWMVREVEESFVIGGATKYLYEITNGDTLRGNIPYVNQQSPWATSNVMAKVSGVTKTSITVFPETNSNGKCARLETRMESCKVLGLINIEVLASGTLFLGQMMEPIRDTKNPQSKLNTGIPFTKRPKALIYDYKTETGGERIRATGFSRIKEIEGPNNSETCILLQHRWEDKDGNIFAKRVGTGWERFEKSQLNWQKDHILPIYYGDIRQLSYYQPYMDLVTGENIYYAKNSKGEMVPIQEIAWAEPNEPITHLVVRMSSSHGGPYIGAPGSKFWIDNIRLGY